MGYIFAHLHTGEEVLKILNYETRSRRVYNFGAVGPDFTYAYNPETEKLLHDDRAIDLADFLLANATNESLDYALGYATHIISDIEMYPVIMKYAGGDFEKYIKLSIIFDFLLAKNVYKTSIEKINLASKVSIGKNLPESIQTLFEDGVSKIYGFKFDVNNSYKKFISFLEFTYDPFLIKRMFYPVVNLVLKINLFNLTYPMRVSERKYEKFYSETLEAMNRGIKESAAYILVRKPHLSSP